MGRRIRRSAGQLGDCGVRGRTYGGVVGLSNQTVVTLSIELDDFGTFAIETCIDWESCEKSCCCNCESLSVDHLGGLDCVCSREGTTEL